MQDLGFCGLLGLSGLAGLGGAGGGTAAGSGGAGATAGSGGAGAGRGAAGSGGGLGAAAGDKAHDHDQSQDRGKDANASSHKMWPFLMIWNRNDAQLPNSRPSQQQNASPGMHPRAVTLYYITIL